MACGRGFNSRQFGPSPPVQLPQTVNQALMSVQALQLDASRCQAKEAHTAIQRAQHGIHARIAKHAAEVVRVVGHLKL